MSSSRPSSATPSTKPSQRPRPGSSRSRSARSSSTASGTSAISETETSRAPSGKATLRTAPVLGAEPGAQHVLAPAWQQRRRQRQREPEADQAHGEAAGRRRRVDQLGQEAVGALLDAVVAARPEQREDHRDAAGDQVDVIDGRDPGIAERAERGRVGVGPLDRDDAHGRAPRSLVDAAVEGVGGHPARRGRGRPRARRRRSTRSTSSSEPLKREKSVPRRSSSSLLPPTRPAPAARPSRFSPSPPRRAEANCGGAASASAAGSGGTATHRDRRRPRRRSAPAPSRRRSTVSSESSPKPTTATEEPVEPAGDQRRVDALPELTLAIELRLEILGRRLGRVEVAAQAVLELLRGRGDDVVGEPDTDQDPDRQGDEDRRQRGCVISAAVSHRFREACHMQGLRLPNRRLR